MFDIAPLVGGFNSVDSVWTIGTTPTQILRPDNHRVLVYISHNAAQTLMLWHNPTVPNLSQPGFIIQPDCTGRMSWSDDGPLVTWGWFAAYSSGSNQVVLLEVTWHPEQLGLG